MVTYLQKITEILSRPSFALDSDISTSSIKYLRIISAIQAAEQQMYETYRLLDSHYEKSVTGASALTLPTGTAFSANGKIYILTSGTTPPLPTDIMRIKKLWITEPTNSTPTGTSSTYDSDSVEGSGIPTDVTQLTITSVFHEFAGDSQTNGQLTVYAGNTAAGATPKVHMTYARTKTAYTNTSNIIDIPEPLYEATFDGVLNTWLKFYLNGQS